jgi:hypothetical protein
LNSGSRDNMRAASASFGSATIARIASAAWGEAIFAVSVKTFASHHRDRSPFPCEVL